MNDAIRLLNELRAIRARTGRDSDPERDYARIADLYDAYEALDPGSELILNEVAVDWLLDQLDHYDLPSLIRPEPLRRCVEALAYRLESAIETYCLDHGIELPE